MQRPKEDFQKVDKPEPFTPAVSPIPLQLSRRSVIRNIATLFSGSAIAQGMTALALLLTARQLGAAQYGQYASSFVLAGFASIVFSLGLDVWLLREGGRQQEKLGELAGSIFVIRGLVGVLWLGIIILLTIFFHPDSFPIHLIPLSAISIWLDSLFAVSLSTFKASLRNHLTSILEGGADILWLLGTLILIRAGETRVETYIEVRILIQLGSLILAFLLVTNLVPLKPTLITIKRAIRESFAYASSELLAWMTMRMDVLIIALMLGEYAVGLYSPAVGLSNALFLVPAAIHLVMVPVLSNLFSTNIHQARITAKRTIVLLIIVGASLSFTLAFSAPILVSALGQSYRGSLEILRILSLILIFKSGSFAMGAILVATGQQARRTIVQAIAALTNLGLNLMVIHWLGIRGVAGVYVITEFVLLAGYTWLVYKRSSLVASATLPVMADRK